MPRLGHKKSRLGCRQCKARHVKCDELKPCSNCARHGVPCSLVTWDPNAQQPAHAAASSSSAGAHKRTGQGSAGVTKTEPTSSTSPSLNIDYVLNPTSAGPHGHPPSGVSEGSSPSSQSDHFPFLSKFVHQKGQSESNQWIRDLELLHHWTIGAGDDLTAREHIRHIMRIEIPKQGVKHTFLMHELLAFAAFHKASQLPDQRAEYYALGIHHQDHTIRGIRERLSNVTPHEAAPLFITSVYLTMTVFAATRFEVESGDLNNGQTFIDGILNIFHLLQGMGNVLALAHQHVLGSFLAPMFMDQSNILPSQPLLSELQQKLPALITFIETVPDIPEPERKVYINAINGYQPALTIAMEPRATAREIRFVFYWPMNLHPDFFACLRQRQPGALVLISYYAVLLVAAQSKHWFMQNWGDSLIRECYELLGPQWRSIVEWPMSLTTHTSTLSFLNDEFFKAPGITVRVPATGATVDLTPPSGDAVFGGHNQTIPPQENPSLGETIPYTQDPSISQDYKGKQPAMGHSVNPSS